MTLKYVIVRRYGREWPIVFPEHYEHRAMVGADSKVVSAGFIARGVAFGRSETLDVDSRPALDTDLLRHWLCATVPLDEPPSPAGAGDPERPRAGF